MAGKTERAVFCDKKVFDLGGMGEMTGETPLATRHRRVVDDDLGLLCRMAAETETVPCLGKQGGVLRVVGVMAGDTLPSLERFVFDRSTRH